MEDIANVDVSESEITPESPPANADEATELLACRLYEKMEHLYPTDPHGEWVRLSEKDRDYYRTLVENLLMADDLVEAALSC